MELLINAIACQDITIILLIKHALYVCLNAIHVQIQLHAHLATQLFIEQFLQYIDALALINILIKMERA